MNEHLFRKTIVCWSIDDMETMLKPGMLLEIGYPNCEHQVNRTERFLALLAYKNTEKWAIDFTYVNTQIKIILIYIEPFSFVYKNDMIHIPTRLLFSDIFNEGKYIEMTILS